MNGASHGYRCHLGRMSKSGHEDIAAFPIHEAVKGQHRQGNRWRDVFFGNF
jgi:hypothetical protein